MINLTKSVFRKRSLTIAAFMTVLIASAPAYNLVATYLGAKAGSGSFTRESSNGNVVKKMAAILYIKGVSSYVNDETTYDSRGAISKDVLIDKRAGTNVSLTTTMSSKGAQVTGIVNGKKISRFVDIPLDERTANASNLWWITIRPKLGTVVVASVFDVQTSTWKVNTITYKADQKITIDNKQVLAHRIFIRSRTDQQEIWEDNNGNLLKFVSGPLVLKKQ